MPPGRRATKLPATSPSPCHRRPVRPVRPVPDETRHCSPGLALTILSPRLMVAEVPISSVSKATRCRYALRDIFGTSRHRLTALGERVPAVRTAARGGRPSPHAGRRHARDRRGTGRRQAPADAFDGCRRAFHSTSGFGRRVDEDRRPPGFGAIRAALHRPVSSAFGLRAREFDLQVPRVLRSPGDWTSHVVPPPGILHWTHVAVPLAEVAHGWVHPADGRLRRSRRGRRHAGRMGRL